MAVHARLKNEFTEDEKCNCLMSWLKCACILISIILIGFLSQLVRSSASDLQSAYNLVVEFQPQQSHIPFVETGHQIIPTASL